MPLIFYLANCCLTLYFMKRPGIEIRFGPWICTSDSCRYDIILAAEPFPKQVKLPEWSFSTLPLFAAAVFSWNSLRRLLSTPFYHSSLLFKLPTTRKAALQGKNLAFWQLWCVTGAQEALRNYLTRMAPVKWVLKSTSSKDYCDASKCGA